MKVQYGGKPLKVLDFDIENRPITYLGSDFTTGEVTAIASAWIVNGKPKSMKCWALTLDRKSLIDMLMGFRERFEEADMVTGHFITGHDLTTLNGAYLRHRLPPLPSRLVHDTKNHLKKRKYVSASQESLGAMLGIEAPKIPMSQQDWYEANTLQPKGIAKTRRRAIGDVRQHVEMREELLRLGWLGQPKVWRSADSYAGSVYTP